MFICYSKHIILGDIMKSHNEFLSKLNDYLKNEELHVNAFVLKEKAKIIYEAYRPPYKKDEIYLQYSISKLLTSIITGISIDRGFFSLEDCAISFFPEKVPQNISENLKSLTIHHLLSMTSGIEEGDYYKIYPYTDWVQKFLALDFPYHPGSVYQYSSHVSHVLSAIIHKTTGLQMSEFAAQNLFEPMGIDKYQFETWKDGETIGGMGISISTRSLSKIGEMLLGRGKYNGKRILSESYIKKMTTNYATGNKYGYAVHLEDDGSYYHAGSFGQLVYAIPEQSIVITVNAAANIHKQLIGFIQNSAVKAHTSKFFVGNKDFKSLLPKQQPYIGKDFTLKSLTDKNPHTIENIELICYDDKIIMKLSGAYNKETERLYSLDGHIYSEMEFVKDTSITMQQAASSAYWEAEDVLILQTIYTQTPYCEKYIFSLKGNPTLEYALNPSLGRLSPLTPENFITSIHIQEQTP